MPVYSPEMVRGTGGMQLNFSTISTGYKFACGTTSTGQGRCFGANSAGQLGDGTNTSTAVSARTIPVPPLPKSPPPPPPQPSPAVLGPPPPAPGGRNKKTSKNAIQDDNYSSLAPPISVDSIVVEEESARRRRRSSRRRLSMYYSYYTGSSGGSSNSDSGSGGSSSGGKMTMRKLLQEVAPVGAITTAPIAEVPPPPPPLPSSVVVDELPPPSPPSVIEGGVGVLVEVSPPPSPLIDVSSLEPAAAPSEQPPAPPTTKPVWAFLSAATADASGGGGHHACGLTSDGRIYCWGDNAEGQLGDGSRDAQLQPTNAVMPVNGSYWISVAAGPRYSCAVTNNSTLNCWGLHPGILAANSSSSSSSSSSSKKGSSSSSNSNTTALQPALTPALILSSGGSGSGVGNWTGISAGAQHACGIQANMSALCFGINSGGALGINTTKSSTTAVLVKSNGGQWLALSAGLNHTCGMQTGGALFCWGNGRAGALGTGTETMEEAPTLVDSTTGQMLPWGVPINAAIPPSPRPPSGPRPPRMSPPPPPPPPSPPPSSSSVPVAAIAGGVVGGLLLLLAAAVGGFLWWRKRKQQRTRVDADASEKAPESPPSSDVEGVEAVSGDDATPTTPPTMMMLKDRNGVITMDLGVATPNNTNSAFSSPSRSPSKIFARANSTGELRLLLTDSDRQKMSSGSREWLARWLALQEISPGAIVQRWVRAWLTTPAGSEHLPSLAISSNRHHALMAPWEFTWGDVDAVHSLGMGSFGQVFLARWKEGKEGKCQGNLPLTAVKVLVDAKAIVAKVAEAREWNGGGGGDDSGTMHSNMMFSSYRSGSGGSAALLVNGGGGGSSTGAGSSIVMLDQEPATLSFAAVNNGNNNGGGGTAASTPPRTPPPPLSPPQQQQQQVSASTSASYMSATPLMLRPARSSGEYSVHGNENGSMMMSSASSPMLVSPRQNSPRFEDLVASAPSIALVPRDTLLKEAATTYVGVNHPNVVAFEGVCLRPPALAFEFCVRGSLYDLLHAGQRADTPGAGTMQLTWSRSLKMMRDAAKGVLYLHSRSPQILHKDLKSNNLLITEDWTVKIADYNIGTLSESAKSSADDDEEEMKNGGGGGGTTTNTTTTGGGVAANPRWLAPEIMEGRTPTTATDSFSFGVVMWEILTWQLPWAHMTPWGIIGMVLSGARPLIPSTEALPVLESDRPGLEEYIALMQRCWAARAGQRPKFKEIVAVLEGLVVEAEAEEGGDADTTVFEI